MLSLYEPGPAFAANQVFRLRIRQLKAIAKIHPERSRLIERVIDTLTGDMERERMDTFAMQVARDIINEFR